MQSVPEWEVFQPPKRENGDRWGIAGYEKSEFREERQISWEKCSINGVSFGWIRIDEYGLGKLTGGMGAFEAFFLADVVTQGKRIRDFSEYDKKMWGQIKSCFAHEGENGSVVLAIPLIDAAKEEMISKLLQEHPIFGFLSGKLQETYQGIKDILKKRANPILQEELSYYASMELCDIRMILMHKEVEEGGLVLPEDPKHSTIGMWLEIS